VVPRLAEEQQQQPLGSEGLTIRTVLFDLGGTLLHYHDPQHGDPKRPFRRVTLLGVRAVLAQASNGSGAPSFEMMTAIVDRHIGEAARALASTGSGGSVETPIRAALAEMGYPLDDAAWAGLRPVYYAQIEPTVTPREGVRETLQALHESGHRLGLVSNTWWSADFHDAHLARYGLLNLLPVRLYSCDLPHTKPHPAIFKTALERIGADAGEAVFVGDRLDNDVKGAQDAGMRAVLIRLSYETGEDTAPDGVIPDAIIDELPELPAALEGLA
jgi:putative hydrolase of the HAD superfamily